MFRSFDTVPDNVKSLTCDQLLTSPRAMQPQLLRQNEGNTVTLFNANSLDAHFAQFPDGVRTSKQIEMARRNGNR